MSSFLGVKDRPNLTGADIKAAYEAEPNTNAYDDAEKQKLKRLTVPSIAAMASIDDLSDGQICVVLPTGETFEYIADSITAADGALVVDATGMGAGRLISLRTTFDTVADMLNDVRTGFSAGTKFTANGFYYEVQPAVYNAGLSTQGGTKLKPAPGIANVQVFGATGDGTTDDTDAVQAAVNYAISIGSNAIFFPLAGGQRYYLTRTVIIEASGFALRGDAAPVYNTDNQGYVFGPSSLSHFFDYGNGRSDLSSNQFVCEKMSFYIPYTVRTAAAIKVTHDNNGPHRGVLMRDTCATGFKDVVLFEAPTASNLAVASVVVENCVFSRNVNVVNAVNRSFGLRYVGNQSEQGARITGAWDSGVTIRDNMLEGQSNPVNIDSNSPNVVVENNYFEAHTGDYIVRFRGTTPNATFTIRPNFVDNILSTDVVRVEHVCRLIERDIFNNTGMIRKSAITLLDAFLVPGSDISGKFYVGIGTLNNAEGHVEPRRLDPLDDITAKRTALASETLYTPFGKTDTGVTIAGPSAAFYDVSASYGTDDVIVACALVRGSSDTRPQFEVFSDNGSATNLKCSATRIQDADAGEWTLMFCARKAGTTGSTARFKFNSDASGSGRPLDIAAVGASVVRLADMPTFNGEYRAFVKLFNPFL